MAKALNTITIKVEADHSALRDRLTELLKDFIVWYDRADTDGYTLNEIVEDFWFDEEERKTLAEEAKRYSRYRH